MDAEGKRQTGEEKKFLMTEKRTKVTLWRGRGRTKATIRWAGVDLGEPDLDSDRKERGGADWVRDGVEWRRGGGRGYGLRHLATGE